LQDPVPADENPGPDVPSEEKQPSIAPFPIVGVGASAGGLEPFSQLLSALPVDTGMAFVLIQHLDPTHKSQLALILARSTRMNVCEVEDGMPLEPNRVYVIPPNTTLRLAEQAFHLSPRPLPVVPHAPIDAFFKSLAAEQGRLSISVVLSGTGSDGAIGSKAIKSACGITFAQSEETAEHPSMPRSAIMGGAIDFVLPPAQIAAELAGLSQHRFVAMAEENGKETLPNGDGELKQIYAMLVRETGVDFRHYKQTTLRRRIGRRMIVHHCDAMSTYASLLRKRPEEVKELYRDLLIHVTSFFRDPDAYAAVVEQLAELVQRQQIKRSFRAWIPGCSTGEEVYSLAIATTELFEQSGLRPDVQFFGTDISEEALETARSGTYPEHLLENLSPERLGRHFKKIDGKYQISKSIRETCIFAKQDVTHDTPFSHLDLISCRNMLIYLEPVLQQALMPIFHYGLNPSGLLFLGKSENVGSSSSLFEVLDSRHRIFARRPGVSRLVQSFSKHSNPAEPLGQVQVQRSISSLDLHKKVDRTIQDRYAPDSVVINEDLQILQFRGHTGFYLEPPAGEATYHLLRMARGGLQHPLRKLIASAIKENAFVQKTNVRVEQSGVTRELKIEVIPLSISSEKERFFLVVFTHRAQASTPAASQKTTKSAADESLLAQLQSDLAESLQYQRAISEDYDSAMEEARAANEELQSANEELQSSNEELETTQEELQSANEELSTVNEELDTRNQQLGILNDDLTNLFFAVNVPILKVDRNLCLRRMTPAAEQLLNIRPADLDQPISDLQTKLRLSLNLADTIRKVMDNLATETHDVQDLNRRWWSVTVRPYRTGDDRLDGTVLAFTDIDVMKRNLQSSQEAQSYADALVETVREPLLVLAVDLCIKRANAAFYETFQLMPAEIEGNCQLQELAIHQWKAPGLPGLLDEVAWKNSSLSDLELELTLPDDRKLVMLINARKLQAESNALILLAFEDVTERRAAAQAVANRLEKTDRELDRTKEELRALAASLMHAREEEQRRIARDLHDDLLQRLAVLQFQVERFRMEMSGGQHSEITAMLASLEGEIASLSDTARNISHRLHPAILDDLGLVAALRQLAEDFSSDGKLTVKFVSRVHSSKLPRGQFAGAAYQIAQEALRNVKKHGAKGPITINLGCKANEMRMTIKDRGPGFDPATVRRGSGLGIINMKERANLLGGYLQVESQPGSSTMVRLRLPLPKADQS